ncbi:MAG: YbjN domain-containing protein [Chloroflexi bacterium]|nr:YbjN domain-containing protein [Chloroflexota bacterium]
MPSPRAEPGDRPQQQPAPEALESWLAELGLDPGPRTERDRIAAWDLALDGRRRRGLPVTLILDPSVGLIVWALLAPPLGDGLRKTYRTLLRWNDEYPLAKFSVTGDGRPILAVELPLRWLDADEVGLALARVVLIADRLFEETRPWLWIGGRIPDGYGHGEGSSTGERLIARFAPRLRELLEPATR